MPARDFQSRPLSHEARKHLLLVACTIDRIDLASSFKTPPTSVRLLSELAQIPWADVALSLGARILPRRGRFLLYLVNLLRRTRR